MPTTTKRLPENQPLDGHAAEARAAADPVPTPRKRSAEATAHGYSNDRTWALCAALRSDSKAHALVQEWLQRRPRSAGPAAGFQCTDAQAVFTPRVLARMKIRVDEMPDGEIDWEEVAEE